MASDDIGEGDGFILKGAITKHRIGRRGSKKCQNHRASCMDDPLNKNIFKYPLHTTAFD